MSIELQPVELGFACEVMTENDLSITSDDWMDWDGGQLGGRPTWLVPKGLPTPESFNCEKCKQPMTLLAQLFAPIEEHEGGHEGTFHRFLYVYICNSACVNVHSNSADGRRPSVLVLRAQLPKQNPYYSENSDDLLVPEISETCYVCGLPSTLRCSGCKTRMYCSRTHQALHWRSGHKSTCRNLEKELDEGVAMNARKCFIEGRALFPLWELTSEREPDAAARSQLAEKNLPTEAAQALEKHRRSLGNNATQVSSQSEMDNLNRNMSALTTEGEKELSINSLTQAELVKTTGAELFADAVLRYFQLRIASNPDQCLRYCRWPSDVLRNDVIRRLTDEEVADRRKKFMKSVIPTQKNDEESVESPAEVEENDEAAMDSDDELEGDEEPLGAPLWFCEQARPLPEDIPSCPNCGANRKFEFQIMPQAISFVQKGNSELDFGTIAVYTCSRSCDVGGVKALSQGLQPLQTVVDIDSPECMYYKEFAWIQAADAKEN